MERRSLRCLPRKSYSELEEPNLDEYVFCEKCADFVYEYCSIHGPLLVIPDDKVPAKSPFPDCVPRAALTIPKVFLHIAPSIIPGAGLGVFSTLTLPRGVRFGPYRGRATKDVDSSYCWQIRDSNNKWSHAVDASDARASNWMRYVNCARHWHEQNLVAYQYQGHIYYRTIKIIPRFTELLVFYGSEFASSLRVDLRLYNSPAGYAQKFGAPAPKKLKPEKNTRTSDKLEKQLSSKGKIDTKNHQTKNAIETVNQNAAVTRSSKKTKLQDINKKSDCKSKIDKNNNKMPTKGPKQIIPSLVSDKTFSLQNNKKATLICDRCGLIFKCNNTLQIHLKTHETEIVENPQTKITDSLKQNDCRNSNSFRKMNTKDQNKNLKYDLSKRVGEKLYKCEYCDKMFSVNSILQTHIRIHTGDKPYKCDYCNKTFSRISHLNTHIRIHTGVKPYKCDYCNKTFSGKGDLIRHIRIHTGDKPYKCDYCNKTFSLNHVLNTHIRIHTGVKPYKCDYCNKTFSQISNLNTHIRIHTGDKPYKCDYCNKTFSQISNLNTHIRIHTGDKPYKCDYCNKTFSGKGDLIRHIRIHTGDKPYKCDYCNKTFSGKGDLIRHIRIHTGVKPYKCDFCKNQFRRPSALKRHNEICNK